MKLSKVQWNSIVLAIVVVAASITYVIYWHFYEGKRQQIETCKIKTVDKYLDERYGDSRPGLDTRIIMDVNKEALASCSH